MKKKIYEQPKTEVVKIEHAEIICASTPTSTFILGDEGEDLRFVEEEW